MCHFSNFQELFSIFIVQVIIFGMKNVISNTDHQSTDIDEIMWKISE